MLKLLLAAGCAAMAAQAVCAAPNDAAVRFGARDNVLGVSISPDGKSLAILQPNGARGAMLSIARVDGSVPIKTILSSDAKPQRLRNCRWATNERLVCTITMIDLVYAKMVEGSRLLAINADGSGMKELSARSSERSLGVALGGGSVIDWLGDDKDGSVLMQRWFIPETTTGSIMTQNRQGLGVERVNLRTMTRMTIEAPNAVANGFLTDGHGNVRIMAIAPVNTSGQSKDRSDFRYRKKGSREWLPLGSVAYSNYRSKGFVPLAIDPDLDVVYGLDAANGRTALYKIALDGSLKKELVFARPDADIDQVTQIGRQDRVVGASWVTDKRQTAMFDPALKTFTAALSKALPNTPNVSLVDASADERQLVLFASSDNDPGRFYLYDRTTKHLGEILPDRPLLAQTPLATMTPIRYPASDGTMVPAYLTLPPGSTGKNIPAIVLPHGGPTYRDEWNFDWLPQYFANRGYVVLQPEYRGSSGYGEEWFANNGFRSWRSSIADVNDAGRWLVKAGIADPAKLAIVGWSYGGYAALQSSVLDPALFKAIVAVAPVTDLRLLREEWTGNSTSESINAILGDAALAQEASPARHADRFGAPVLLFHGDIDQNVAIGESRLMASRLKSAGKAVDLIEYKGLDHQLDDSVVRADMLDRADTFLRTTMKM